MLRRTFSLAEHRLMFDAEKPSPGDAPQVEKADKPADASAESKEAPKDPQEARKEAVARAKKDLNGLQGRIQEAKEQYERLKEQIDRKKNKSPDDQQKLEAAAQVVTDLEEQGEKAREVVGNDRDRQRKERDMKDPPKTVAEQTKREFHDALQDLQDPSLANGDKLGAFIKVLASGFAYLKNIMNTSAPEAASAPGAPGSKNEKGGEVKDEAKEKRRSDLQKEMTEKGETGQDALDRKTAELAAAKASVTTAQQAEIAAQAAVTDLPADATPDTRMLAQNALNAAKKGVTDAVQTRDKSQKDVDDLTAMKAESKKTSDDLEQKRKNLANLLEDESVKDLEDAAKLKNVIQFMTIETDDRFNVSLTFGANEQPLRDVAFKKLNLQPSQVLVIDNDDVLKNPAELGTALDQLAKKFAEEAKSPKKEAGPAAV